LFLWYIIGVILCLIISCEYYAFKTGVPTVTSFPSVRKKMVELIVKEASQRKNKPLTLLDLGSGTGKLALEIAKALPETNVIGIEISLIPYFISNLRRIVWRVKNVSFQRKDFWACDVSQVDIVTVYINDHIRERMGQKLKAELPSGAFVLSNETHLPGWTPIKIFETGLLKLKILAYRQA